LQRFLPKQKEEEEEEEEEGFLPTSRPIDGSTRPYLQSVSAMLYYQ
jgi:hypothetical protein